MHSFLKISKNDSKVNSSGHLLTVHIYTVRQVLYLVVNGHGYGIITVILLEFFNCQIFLRITQHIAQKKKDNTLSFQESTLSIRKLGFGLKGT